MMRRRGELVERSFVHTSIAASGLAARTRE
jgi:hypothetical protein